VTDYDKEIQDIDDQMEALNRPAMVAVSMLWIFIIGFIVFMMELNTDSDQECDASTVDKCQVVESKK